LRLKEEKQAREAKEKKKGTEIITVMISTRLFPKSKELQADSGT
jgi:hypothetical protein